MLAPAGSDSAGKAEARTPIFLSRQSSPLTAVHLPPLPGAEYLTILTVGFLSDNYKRTWLWQCSDCITYPIVEPANVAEDTREVS